MELRRGSVEEMFPEEKRIYLHPNSYLAGIIITLNFIDAILTSVILSREGRELNPIWDWSIQNFGMIGFTLIKVLLASLLVIYVARREPRDVGTSILLATAGFFAGIVFYQLTILVRVW